jgi:hypothetical protein
MWLEAAMGQITLYLDPETEKSMAAAAKAAGTSKSRWVAELIRQQTASEWPGAVARLAGSWALDDFPTLEEIRQEVPDEAREPI